MREPEKTLIYFKKQNSRKLSAQLYLSVICCAMILLIFSYIFELIFSDTNIVSSVLSGLGRTISKYSFLSIAIGIALTKNAITALPSALVGALLITQGNNFSNIGGNISGISGIFGSILAGYTSVLSVKLWKRIIKSKNKNINSGLLTSIASIITTALVVLSVNSLSSLTNSVSMIFLKTLADSKTILFPITIGLFTVIDGGGPLFFCAYIFANTSIMAQEPQVMAAVIAAGMIPSLSAALYAYIYKDRLENYEVMGAYIGVIPALFGLPQTSYLFYITRRMRFIIPSAIGCSITSVISVMLGCTAVSAEKGFLNISEFNNPLYLILSIISGILISTALMSLTIRAQKSEHNKKDEENITATLSTAKA